MTASRVIARMVSHMVFSKSSNHFSTHPRSGPLLGQMGLPSATSSFSLLIMFTMAILSSRPSSNLTLLIPSKHLPRNGCTARGFFVCDKITSSSSAERK